MSKAKTNKSVKKRFIVTKTGKVLYRPGGLNHFLSKKTGKQIRDGRGLRELTGTLAKSIKRLLPYS
ncbi:MAG: 50S ribosomal protein L35 [Patescibacteria group bacterium]